MPRLEHDRRLLDAFRAGRREAMAAVYQEYAPLLGRMLRSAGGGSRFHMLRSAFEMENLIAEVFARSFEPDARLAYDGLRPYEAFLWGIARNCVSEGARRRERATGEPLIEGASLPEASPEAQAEDREVDALLSTFVGELDAQSKDLFRVRFQEGRSQADAARTLNWSRIVLRRRERKLKQRLLELLQSRGYLSGLAARGWSFARHEE
jgi:RNA polymerase sigma factor (sigma-70 family)